MFYSNFSKVIAFPAGKRSFSFGALSVGVLAMAFLISYIVLAWTEPGAAPPAGNVPAPINVGPSAQTKTGALGIGALDSNYGLTVATSIGGIKITNTSTQSSLYIEDESGDVTPFVVNADGNVGIGTATPSEKLTVQSDSGGRGIINVNQIGTDNWAGLKIDRDGTEKWFIGISDANDYLRLRRDGTSDDLVIDSDGNVGIGTPTPGITLHVSNPDTTAGDLEVARFEAPSANGANEGQYITVGTRTNNEGAYMVYYSADDRVGFGRHGGGPVINIKGGKVGIGTTDPGNYKLKVDGDGNIAGNLTVVGSDLKVGTGGAGYVYTGNRGYYFGDDLGGSDVQTNAPNFYVYDGGWKRLCREGDTGTCVNDADADPTNEIQKFDGKSEFYKNRICSDGSGTSYNYTGKYYPDYICFLTKAQFKEVDGPNESPSCAVYTDSSNQWYLAAYTGVCGDCAAYCGATCVKLTRY